MQVIRTMTSHEVTPLVYDAAGVMMPGTGLTPEDLAGIAEPLARARSEVLADFELWKSGRDVPAYKQPLEPAFIELPAQLLEEYRRSRATSPLNQILATAEKLANLVDRVVVLGAGGSSLGAGPCSKAAAIRITTS